ncbi:type I polyketide synthase [Tumebacillus lipolyticus]|uniref:Beta-ketoacyl synthase N-terminal-like domain-containing protein n=1 Tax=Tumebacillus lipolyticus TaxID=1280370 RepID=A0ABW4ZSQ7_9BACL
MNQFHGHEIAVIGMTGRFPGAKDIEQFWDNLKNGIESIRFFSREELLAAGIPAEQVDDPNYVPAKGVLDGADMFDAAFFGFSKREAEVTDPQQRLFLECSHEALEHAGYDPGQYRGRIGVYGGSNLSTYLYFNLFPNQEIINSVGLTSVVMGNDKDHLATRVSYKLNLTGPSVCVQTACSTSLVAIHTACQAIISGECDIALAGGVSIGVPQISGYPYQEGSIASPDGHCRAFDARSGGTVSSNGVGVVVLKLLEDALADGDTIHAVIRGSAINNDGANKIGYTAPSAEGQAAAISEAMAVAKVPAESISYVEAHGTATNLGDPIEILGLTKAFRTRTEAKEFCAIGSVKTNVGHLDAAAGVTGLIKTALSLKHQLLPPSLHFELPNPKIDFVNSPFYVNNKLSPWLSEKGPRRAGVSSFGMGGTNAHVILEEAPASVPTGPSRGLQLLMLSAKTSTALEAVTERLLRYFEQHPQVSLADTAYTLQVGRASHPFRRLVLCRDVEEAKRMLRERPSDRVINGASDMARRPAVLLFPGSGAEELRRTAQELYASESAFRQQLDKLREVFLAVTGQNLDIALSAPQQQTEDAVLFVLEYALAKLWLDWGLQPEALIGHGVGSFVSAALAQVLTVQDALVLVTERARLLGALPQAVALEVPLSAAELAPVLGSELSVVEEVGPHRTIIAGPRAAIEEFQRDLADFNVRCTVVTERFTLPSAISDATVGAFWEKLQVVRLHEPQLPVLCSTMRDWLSVEQATDARFWAEQLRTPVSFSDGLQDWAKKSAHLYLEIGTMGFLGERVRSMLPAEQAGALWTSVRDENAPWTAAEHLQVIWGEIWLQGGVVDGAGYHRGEARRRIPLPTYPFERQSFWVGQIVQPFAAGVSAKGTDEEVLLDTDNEIELNIAKIWSELLGIKQVTLDDDFYELGGDSLLSIQLIARIKKLYPVELDMRQLVEATKIGEFAEIVELALIEELERL